MRKDWFAKVYSHNEKMLQELPFQRFLIEVRRERGEEAENMRPVTQPMEMYIKEKNVSLMSVLGCMFINLLLSAVFRTQIFFL